jgi:hypothetical protein
MRHHIAALAEAARYTRKFNSVRFQRIVTIVIALPRLPLET